MSDEIIKCKDCKYWTKQSSHNEEGICDVLIDEIKNFVHESNGDYDYIFVNTGKDYYCSKGKQKNNLIDETARNKNTQVISDKGYYL